MLAPYPTVARRPHASVTLDPDSQLGVFTDRAGTVIEMGKHGTARGTETSTVTNLGLRPSTRGTIRTPCRTDR